MHGNGGNGEDGGGGDDLDIIVILIKHGHRICFYIAVTCGNNNIEDAKAVCC
jgi:hypothetical protein